MNKIIIVAWREFIETIKTKTFLFSTVLMPLLVVGLMFGADAVNDMAKQEKQPTRTLAVLDETELLEQELASQIVAYNAENPNRPLDVRMLQGDATVLESARQQVQQDELYGYLHVPLGAIVTGEACLLGRKDNTLEAGIEISRLVNRAIENIRLRDAGMDPNLVQLLQKDVTVRTVDVATGAESTNDIMARVLTPFAFMFFMWMGTTLISQGLLTSVIEEKSSRVVEVLLSAVSPLQLMIGKIVGMVLVSSVLLLVWGGVGFAASRYSNLEAIVSPYAITLLVLYFIPGFLLNAALLAAIGSACNTLKDAQSMAFPLSLVTMVPMLFWFPISQNPGSMLSVVLSFVPPITPFVMVLRVCSDPGLPVWEVAATQAVLWTAVLVALWASGKVFRIGVLMYGKPPTPRELLRWVRMA